MNIHRSKQALRYLNWLLNPSHGLGTAEVYELIGTASPTRDALYLNLGYWRDAETIDDASVKLATLVAETGRMGPGDTVLDCGFGFGDQDILWARQFEPAAIIGLNITGVQVEKARSNVREAGCADRIDLRPGSATNMPLENASVDLVVALESAFHFETREQFFDEAFRVLRPGGRLVTADILPAPRADGRIARLRQRLSWYLVASRFNIPDNNVYGIPEYAHKLERAGFRDVSIESIRDRVYAPLHAFLRENPAYLERQHPLARIVAGATLMRKAENVYAGLDYVIAHGDKPAGAHRAADETGAPAGI